MSAAWARHRATMTTFVERVSQAYGAVTVFTDAPDLGAPSWHGFTVPSDQGLPTPESRPDVVVSVDAPGRMTGWEEHLLGLGRLTRKVLVVFVANPGRVWPRTSASATAVAGVLWQAGRVRERAYVGAPRALGPTGVVDAPASALVRRLAPLQAYVVDTAPRSPQARRRTRLAVV